MVLSAPPQGLSSCGNLGRASKGSGEKQQENHCSDPTRLKPSSIDCIEEQCSLTLLEKGGLWRDGSLNANLKEQELRRRYSWRLDICLLAPSVPLHPCSLQTLLDGSPCFNGTLLQILGQPQLCPCSSFVAVTGGLSPGRGSLRELWAGQTMAVPCRCCASMLCCAHYLIPHLQLPAGPGKSLPDLFTCQEIFINYPVS